MALYEPTSESKLVAKVAYILKERKQVDSLELLKHSTKIEINIDNDGSGNEPLLITLYGDVFLVDSLIRDEVVCYGESKYYTLSNKAGLQLERAFEDAHNIDDDNAGTVRIYGRLYIPDIKPNWSDTLPLALSEIYMVVNDFIEVHGGYLGDFSYRTHAEFYPQYCNLDIDTNKYEGTTRERFIKILRDAQPGDQAKILKGVLSKYPLIKFPEEVREYKQTIRVQIQQIIERLDPQSQHQAGVSGDVKNLIFAANGPKPEIVLSDAVSNRIEIVKNAEYCLVYDLQISDKGLLWNDLIHWWAKKNNHLSPNDEVEFELYHRLRSSLASAPEKLLFETYFKTFRRVMNEKFPALIPQVYLHYDPKTLKELSGIKRLPRQRMDFLLLFSGRDRIVIEIDGQQHYAIGEKADPKLYAQMVAADRQLRLQGYEVYRFGGYELNDMEGRQLVNEFFKQLFNKYDIGVPNIP